MRIAFTRGTAKKVGLAMLVCCGALASATSASAEEAPRIPEEVAEYFATGLIPRLVDLYGPGADGTSRIDFDETAKVGTINRVLVWTEDFRAGHKTDKPVQLTNDWVAPITVGDDEHVGLATVWISPHNNLPELADFTADPTLGPVLAQVPEGSLLIHDEQRSAWFALVGDTLTPLVAGTSGITGSSTSLAEAQAVLLQQSTAPAAQRSNGGFVIAGLTLGFVVVLLSIFVLIPDRKRSVLDPDAELGFPATVESDETVSQP